MVQSIIEGLRNYLASCPLLAVIPVKDRHVDWTSADRENYGIFKDSDEPLGAPYISGAQEMQYVVQINVRKLSDSDIKRLENCAFSEQLSGWVLQQERDGRFPELPENCEPTGISVINSGSYNTDEAGKKSAYFIQIALNYIRYGGN